MKNKALLVLLVLLVASLSGCSLTSHSTPVAGVGGITLDPLSRDQYEVLDTVEGKGEVTVYIGLITVPYNHLAGMTTSAWTDYSAYVVQSGKGSVGVVQRNSGSYKAYQMALYDALKKIPNADAVLPLSAEMTESGSFFAKKYTATVKCKAIRIKTDKELGK